MAVPVRSSSDFGEEVYGELCCWLGTGADARGLAVGFLALLSDMLTHNFLKLFLKLSSQQRQTSIWPTIPGSTLQGLARVITTILSKHSTYPLPGARRYASIEDQNRAQADLVSQAQALNGSQVLTTDYLDFATFSAALCEIYSSYSQHGLPQDLATEILHYTFPLYHSTIASSPLLATLFAKPNRHDQLHEWKAFFLHRAQYPDPITCAQHHVSTLAFMGSPEDIGKLKLGVCLFKLLVHQRHSSVAHYPSLCEAALVHIQEHYVHQQEAKLEESKRVARLLQQIPLAEWQATLFTYTPLVLDRDNWQKIGKVKLRLYEWPTDKTVNICLRMWHQDTRQLVANHLLRGTSLVRHASSNNAWVWHASHFEEGKVREKCFCCKFKSQHDADSFERDCQYQKSGNADVVCGPS